MKIAVLLSGTGRTLDNFHDQISRGAMRGSIEVVISNVNGVLGLQKAEDYGYPSFYAKTDQQINKIIAEHNIELILLAGYLKLYTPPNSLKQAVLNIHPSLIPAFCGSGYYGMRVHRAVYTRGVLVSGCTVHFANADYDEGPIVLQKSVLLDDDDVPEIIADKVFAAECEAFPQAVNKVCEKGIAYFWQREADRK